MEEQLGPVVQALEQKWYENPFKLSNWESEQCRWMYNGRVAAKNIHWLRGPVKIPAVRNLLNGGFSRRGPQEGVKWKTRRWSRVASGDKWNVTFNVPLDVKLLILDYLGHKDIRNTVGALGWQIPDSYWRSRFPGNIIFGVEQIGSRNVDWQYLCLEAECLLEKSDALLNQRRKSKSSRAPGCISFN